MADLFPHSTAFSREGWGVQAYRAVVVIGLALLSALSMRVLGQIDRTTEIAYDLKMLTGMMNSRLDAQGRRIDGNDSDIKWIREQLYQAQRNRDKPMP